MKIFEIAYSDSDGDEYTLNIEYDGPDAPDREIWCRIVDMAHTYCLKNYMTLVSIKNISM